MTRSGLLSVLIVVLGLFAASCGTGEAPSALPATTVPEALAATGSSTSTAPTSEAPVAAPTTTDIQAPAIDQTNKPQLQARFENAGSIDPDEWQCVTDYVATSTPNNTDIALGLVSCAPETISETLTLEAEQEGLVPPIFDIPCLFAITDDEGVQLAAASHLLLMKVGETPPELFAAYREAAPACTPGWLLGDIAEAYLPLSDLGFTASTLAHSTDPDCLAEVSQGADAAPVWDNLFGQLSERRIDFNDPELRKIQMAILDCVNAGRGVGMYATESTGLELDEVSLTCLADSVDGTLMLESTDPTIDTIDRIEAIATSCISEGDLEELGLLFNLQSTRYELEDRR